MNCEQNCEACVGCDISGVCGELAPDDGEVLTRIAAFGREFSRKLLISSSYPEHANHCLLAVLFGKFLRITPHIPRWIDRDRLVVGDNNILPWLYLAGFPIQLDDIIFPGRTGGISEDLDFQSFGIGWAAEPQIVKAVDMAISHKKMTTSLQQRGIPCLSKVLALTGNISHRDPTVAESLRLAADAKLDNLIIISEENIIDNSVCISISELRTSGFHVEEIGENDVQTIYENLIRARLNSQRQPQIIITHGHTLESSETSQSAFTGETITHEDFLIPDTIHNYFALLNMRKNNDYENWQYRFECAVDFHPEILQFVEGLHAH
ncbi:MAG: hypothetical protein LBB26_02500 [Puniceicoccales bacterium]|jgi:transketolase|nr:hypothetical protein [Puniceicoccales bacterium]